ncbi:MAG: hypothetical protein M3R59_07065 [Verrucomicrobiota bacterium]|nr:hypothetical protein [Verrucomicrobiota bacterium]
MADSTDPIPPPVPPPSNPATTGLPSNVAAALACFPLIGGIIFYILEKRDNFVRFYAMQSIIFGAGWLVFNIASAIIRSILWSLPIVGHFFGVLWTIAAAIIQLGLFVLMVIAMIKALSGARWDIPYVGPIARKQVGEA